MVTVALSIIRETLEHAGRVAYQLTTGYLGHGWSPGVLFLQVLGLWYAESDCV